MHSSQLLGVMYNQLADILLIQDRTFLLQMICLMLEQTVDEVIPMFRKGLIDLSQFYTFDNEFKFHKFDLIKIQELSYKVDIFQSHILAHIINLDEVRKWLSTLPAHCY